MSELTEKDAQLKACRLKLLDYEELFKKMTISSEKHMRERQSMLEDMRTLEVKNLDINSSLEQQ